VEVDAHGPRIEAELMREGLQRGRRDVSLRARSARGTLSNDRRGPHRQQAGKQARRDRSTAKARAGKAANPKKKANKLEEGG